MNACHFSGNLTRDVESRAVGSGNSMAYKFGLAVNGKPYKKQDGSTHRDVVFLDCEAWNQLGEVIDKYFAKGDPIIVHGELKQETWEDKQTGQNRSKTLLRVSDFEFPQGKKRDEPEAQAQSPEPAAPKRGGRDKAATAAATAPDGGFEATNDIEIPF